MRCAHLMCFGRGGIRGKRVSDRIEQYWRPLKHAFLRLRRKQMYEYVSLSIAKQQSLTLAVCDI